MSYTSRSCHSDRTWGSCRLGNRVHRQTFRCPASSSPAMGQSQLPFGGAIVAKLAGSAKLLKGEQQIIPLLGPGRAFGQPELPFGASLECVKRSSLDEPHVAGAASVRCTSYGSGTWTDDAVATSSRMLDVLYVLAGTGSVETADGTVRRLHAGDSLIAWHNTTELRSTSDDQPPAVLKFHFPASVLMLPPGCVVAPSPSHADLQILVNECQGDYDGELSQQEAADMLSGVQQRASKAIAHLYNNNNNSQSQSTLDEINGPNASAMPDRTAHITLAPATTRSAPSSSPSPDLRPSVPHFPGWLLRHVAASAASSIRALKSALAAAFVPRAAARFTPRPLQGPSLAAAGTLSPQHLPQQQLPQQQGPGAVASSLYGGSKSLPSSSPSSGSRTASSGCVLLQRALEDFKAFRFPRQTNKLAFVFDPTELGLSLSFGVEVFEPGHHTPLHIHKAAHELFFVLAGEGVAFCNGQRFPVRAGDCVVFPPRAVHGIDNTSTGSKLYCLQLMTPNESFVEHVKSGEEVGRLDDEDLCNLTSRHC